MRLMIEMSEHKHYPVTPKVLKSLAKNIKYYPGVRTFFDRLNAYVETQFDVDVKLRHYIISAGLKEIISGASIARHFYKIFASEYHYDEYDKAVFPKVIVNDTLKTQFIFRINKGKESLHENINLHMPVAQRPVPFENILPGRRIDGCSVHDGHQKERRLCYSRVQAGRFQRSENL